MEKMKKVLPYLISPVLKGCHDFENKKKGIGLCSILVGMSISLACGLKEFEDLEREILNKEQIESNGVLIEKTKTLYTYPKNKEYLIKGGNIKLISQVMFPVYAIYQYINTSSEIDSLIQHQTKIYKNGELINIEISYKSP